VFEQGERGESFYIVESGRAAVVCDGRVIGTLGRGSSFGEIALLRDRPRTAAVRASADANMRMSVLAAEVVTGRLKADAERRREASVSRSGTTWADLRPEASTEDGERLADSPE